MQRNLGTDGFSGRPTGGGRLGLPCLFAAGGGAGRDDGAGRLKTKQKSAVKKRRINRRK